MRKLNTYRVLMLLLSLFCLVNLAGCAAHRVAGWERETEQREGDVARLLSEAEQEWAQRGDVAHLEKAIELYEEVVKIDQNNLDVLITLARAHYFVADAYLAEEVERQTEAYDTSIAYAEKAMALHPEFKGLVDGGEKVEDAIRVLDKSYVGAIYWASASLGRWSVNKGLATMLANKERGRKMMARCLELDETYFYGGPHRWFGAYYAKLPSIAGRDLPKSKEHFEKALQIAPNYFGTRILRAEQYSKNAQDKELYRSDLEFVLNTPSAVIPAVAPEHDVDKKKATNMLEAIDETFL